MFALGIRYLNGWAMASHPANREQAEWPPHPDRVFMALAAAHFESGDEAGGDADERAALEWLQSLPPPSIAVGDHDQRAIVTSYVPVNDTEIARRGDESKRLAAIDKLRSFDQAKDAGLGLLPEFRGRQSRSFAVAIPLGPDDVADGMPRVYLIWNADVPDRHRKPLDSLSAKVTSIGHSASFAQVWIDTNAPAATLVPVDVATPKHRLRVSDSSRLQHLESRYKTGLRPGVSLWQGYGEPPKAIAVPGGAASSIFDSQLIVLRRVEGPRLGLESTLQLTEALRGAVMSRCRVQPPPSWISGHPPSPNSGRGEEPHLAFIPLADVGQPQARGHLLGVAIVVPRDIEPDEQKALSPVLFHTREDESAHSERFAGTLRQLNLTMGRAGAWRVELADEDPRVALRPGVWTGLPDGAPDNAGSVEWATVTPIVFDRHPRETWSVHDAPRVLAERQASYWRDVEGMIADACERIGLPRPVQVVATPASAFQGAPTSNAMPRMARKDGTQKRQTHAVLRFDRPVIGPVLLGAGRYRGYGLCRPLLNERSSWSQGTSA